MRKPMQLDARHPTHGFHTNKFQQSNKQQIHDHVQDEKTEHKLCNKLLTQERAHNLTIFDVNQSVYHYLIMGSKSQDVFSHYQGIHSNMALV
jgi:hypothetical protein